MNRHATLDELAKLGADDLRPRKAARVNLHLAGCPECTQLNNELSGVPALLSSIQFTGMPENLSARIDSALAAEAANRVAAEPATEAGRRDLPVRSAAAGRRPGFNRPHREHLAWRLPVPATRVLATAAAILIVGVGGYAIASHSGGAAPSSTAKSAAGLVTPFRSQGSTGPAVTYQQAGSARSIATVTSTTNFEASKLADQAATAVAEARVDGVRSFAVKKGNAVNSSLAEPSASVAGRSDTLGAAASAPNNSQLTGCVDRVIGHGQVVLLVERAKFEGKPATIIVTEPASASGTSPPKQAEIWAVGSACSETNSVVLDHVKVARL